MHDVWSLASLFYDQNCSLWLESRQLSLITGTTQVFIASTVLKCFQHLDFNYFLDIIIIIINPPSPPPSLHLYRALKMKLCYFVILYWQRMKYRNCSLLTLTTKDAQMPNLWLSQYDSELTSTEPRWSPLQSHWKINECSLYPYL